MQDNKAIPLRTLMRLWSGSSLQSTKHWSQVRSPLQAALLDLRRIDWKWSHPFRFTDDLNNEINLLDASARQVSRLLLQGHIRQMERQIAADHPDTNFAGISFAHISQLLKSKKSPADHKGILTCWATGGWWTKDRMLSAGYLTGAQCLCGEPDSLHHRLWTCSHTRVLRDKAFNDAEVEWGTEFPHRVDTTCGWLPHSSEEYGGVSHGSSQPRYHHLIGRARSVGQADAR
jgi:hypothetical protein